MVAYSFAPQFTLAVETLEKCQTVRGLRKRHAYPGEPLQLYAGMRTRHCRKLVDPDPVCLDLRLIRIERLHAHDLNIWIEETRLSPWAVEQFAALDGFGPPDAWRGTATRQMAEFWLKHHGPQPFSGVVIRWLPTQ